MTGARREWKAGRQALRFDPEHQVLWIRIGSAMTVEEYQEIMRITWEVFPDHRSRCIWDLQGRVHRLSREVRRAMKEQVKADRDRGITEAGKSAIIGATYSVRVLAMIFIRLLGGVDRTRFCATEAEALAFLSRD